MDQEVSDLSRIRENYLIRPATKMKYELLFCQIKDFLHTIFLRWNQIRPLRDMFGVLQTVFRLRNPRKPANESKPWLFRKIYHEKIFRCNFSFWWQLNHQSMGAKNCHTIQCIFLEWCIFLDRDFYKLKMQGSDTSMPVPRKVDDL